MIRFLAFVVMALVLAGSASAAFYGPATGKARKACIASGGTWTTYLQVCQH